MIFKIETNKKDLIEVRQKFNSSSILANIGIVVEFVKVNENGTILSEICCSKFKAEPFKNQWRAIKRIIGEYTIN